MLGSPGLETGVAGTEIILLLIARTVGNVALAIGAEDFAIRIRDDDRIVVARPVLLEDRDRDNDLQRLGELHQRQHARMLIGGIGRRKPLRVLLGAKIDALEQLGRQDDLRARLSGLADEALGSGDVILEVVAV